MVVAALEGEVLERDALVAREVLDGHTLQVGWESTSKI